MQSYSSGIASSTKKDANLKKIKKKTFLFYEYGRKIMFYRSNRLSLSYNYYLLEV